MTSAGAPTKRWPPAERSGSRPTRGRTTDGPFDRLPGTDAAQSARRLRVPALEYRRRRPAARRRRCRRGRALLPVRGATAPGGRTERAAGRGGHGGFRRVPVLLPGRGRGGGDGGWQRGCTQPAPLPEPARARRGGGRHTGHRQHQRHDARRLDQLRARDARRGRRGDRAEHLLHTRRPAHHRPRGRAAAHRHPGPGQGRGDRARGGQAEPALQLGRRDGPAA